MITICSPEHGSFRRVVLSGIVASLASISVCGLAAFLLVRVLPNGPLVTFVLVLCGVGTLCAGQIVFYRTVRKAFAPLLAARTRLVKAIGTDDTRSSQIESDSQTASIVELTAAVVNGAKDAERSMAEFEFANKVFLREHRRVHTAIDSVGIGVIAAGVDGRIILANRAGQPFLAVPAADAIGKPLEQCIADRRILSLVEGTDGGAGAAGKRLEISIDDQPSSPVFCVKANTISEDGNGIIGTCLQFEDITSVKRAASAREEFVDSVAHELRTPLTSMKAYVEMLIDGEASDREAQYEFYNIIYEETDRLSRLINNLLNISRMEAGAIVVNRTPARLKRLIEDSITVVESQIEKKQILLNVDLPDRLPAVEVDKDMMSVVFVNLMGNAAKYTPEMGRISVSSSSLPEEILIHVTDTGIGIAEDDVEHVFDKFFRCAGQAEDEVAGSGLGLCLARQIIRLHGGDIRVSSKLGEGSQFSVVLPRSAVVTTLGDYEHDQVRDSDD